MSAQPANGGGVPIQMSPQRSPVAISIANYLFQNPILKQRTGLLENTNDVDFFRYKRFERALLSEDYKTKLQNPKNGLIPIKDSQEVQRILILLIQNQLIIPIQKLHYAEIKAIKGWKPNKQKPTIKKSDKALIDPNAYYGWLYLKPNPYILLYSLLAISGVFAIILFPLWPTSMRRGVWYLSMGALGLIALFFGIAIVRLIIYLVSLVVCPKPFWLFPNLFEDCGVIESFQPVYGWEEPKKKKSKKSKKKDGKGESANNGQSDSAATASGSQVSNGGAEKRKVRLEEVDE